MLFFYRLTIYFPRELSYSIRSPPNYKIPYQMSMISIWKGAVGMCHGYTRNGFNNGNKSQSNPMGSDDNDWIWLSECNN